MTATDIETATPERTAALPVGRLLLALLLGAGLTVAALLGYYLSLERYGQSETLRYGPDQLKLALGQGEETATGVTVRGLDEERGFAQVSGTLGSLIRAERVDELRWRIEGLQPDTEIDLLWIDQFRQPRLAPLTHDGGDSGRMILTDVPDWQGVIAGIGLIVRTLPDGPLTVRELVLRPALPDAVGLLQRLWRQWTAFEGWRGYSEHLIVGGAGELAGPTPVVALWLLLSALVYGLLGGLRRHRRRLAPFVVLLLAGWLVLDLRWQWDLGRQLERSIAELAGKSRVEQLRTYDNVMSDFIEEVRQALPAEPVRIFLLGGDRESYEYARVPYRLIPHNVYGFRARPPPRRALARFARPGDYLLVLLPVDDIRYRRIPGNEALLWDDEVLPVKVLLAERQGLLFQVREAR